jgi:sec-independent protein translocase protein TatA
MPEMLVIMAIAVLLFGKRLPEVGRSLGRGLVEFKKGLRGMEDNLHASTFDDHLPAERPKASSPVDAGIPKFEPPSTPPTPRIEPEAAHYQD